MRELIQKKIIFPAIISLLAFPFSQFLFSQEITAISPETTPAGIVVPGLAENATEVSGVHQSLMTFERNSLWVSGHYFSHTSGISHKFSVSETQWVILLFLSIIALLRLILEVVYKHDGKKAVALRIC